MLYEVITAADAHVHLVEDEGGDGTCLDGGHLDGEADAGELAARGHLGQRPGRLPRVRAHSYNFV